MEFLREKGARSTDRLLFLLFLLLHARDDHDFADLPTAEKSFEYNKSSANELGRFLPMYVHVLQETWSCDHTSVSASLVE